MEPHAMLFVSNDGAELYFFSDREAGKRFGGASPEMRPIYLSTLENTSLSQSTYARPSLAAIAQKGYGSAIVFTFGTDALKNRRTEKDKNESFELQVEFRNYNKNFTGERFAVQGHIVESAAVYSCRML